MALVTPDFSEVSDAITPGEYRVRVTGSELGEYKTGTKYIKWTLETFGEENAKNDGRKIWHNTIFSGKGAFMLQSFWNAATGNADMGEGDFDTEMLLGKELSVVTNTNDRGYTEVKVVKPIQ